MMRSPIRSLHLVLPLALFLASCLDEPDPLAPLFDLSGVVEVRSELGDPVTPVEGVTVTVTGTSASWSVTADASGAFRVAGLEAGEYAVRIEKPGFGTVAMATAVEDVDELELVLPARSSASVESVQAAVDRACGTAPCLDLTVRVPRRALFPEGGTRRLFRLFVRGGGEATPDAFDRTLLLLVTADDPALTLESDVATIVFDNIRSLDLEAYGLEAELSLRVYGATENAAISYVDPASGSARYPDLSEAWADASVQVGAGGM